MESGISPKNTSTFDLLLSQHTACIICKTNDGFAVISVTSMALEEGNKQDWKTNDQAFSTQAIEVASTFTILERMPIFRHENNNSRVQKNVC